MTAHSPLCTRPFSLDGALLFAHDPLSAYPTHPHGRVQPQLCLPIWQEDAQPPFALHAGWTYGPPCVVPGRRALGSVGQAAEAFQLNFPQALTCEGDNPHCLHPVPHLLSTPATHPSPSCLVFPSGQLPGICNDQGTGQCPGVQPGGCFFHCERQGFLSITIMRPDRGWDRPGSPGETKGGESSGSCGMEGGCRDTGHLLWGRFSLTHHPVQVKVKLDTL